jgi:transcriptional regulator with XRE-family HTH domain
MMTPFRIQLISELEARKRKNARFSLRAFARLLELAPSTVHQYLSGRYYPNARNLQQMAAKLEWSDQLLQSYLQRPEPLPAEAAAAI